MMRATRVLFCALPIVTLMLAASSDVLAQRTELEAKPALPGGKLRSHYIAAEEVDWDYAPLGRDEMMGHPFMDGGQDLRRAKGREHRPRAQKGDLRRIYRRDVCDQEAPPRGVAAHGHPGSDPQGRGR